MEITEATALHLDTLVPLFDGYRVFYDQASNPKGAREFLKERLSRKDSRIFLALDKDGDILGFTQLYPIFSSVSMQPMYLLNDLYVPPKYRNRHLGTALLNHAKRICIKENRKGLLLQTGEDNPAQHLYERLGWKKENDLFYFWSAVQS